METFSKGTNFRTFQARTNCVEIRVCNNLCPGLLDRFSHGSFLFHYSAPDVPVNVGGAVYHRLDDERSMHHESKCLNYPRGCGLKGPRKLEN